MPRTPAKPMPLVHKGAQRMNDEGQLAWRLRVRDKRSGRQPERTFYGTQAEATAELERWRAEVLGTAKPALPDARTLRLGPWSVEWLRSYAWKVKPVGQNPGVRRDQNTWRNARAQVRAYIAPHPIARKPLVSITYQDCYDHIAGLRVADGAREAAPATKEKAASVLRMILAAAKADGLLTTNPAADLPTSWGHSRKKVVVPSLRQTEQLAEAIDTEWGSPYGDIVRVFAYTAMRWEDLAALTRDKVDLENRLILINEVRPSGGTQTRAGTKTQPDRHIVIIDQAVAPLERLMAYAEEKGSDHVMVGRRGGPLNYSLWRKHLDKARKATGVPYTAHALRHTCISLLIAAGVPPRQVADQAGHSRTQMTETVYRHAYKLAAAGKLAAELTRAVTSIEVEELNEDGDAA